MSATLACVWHEGREAHPAKTVRKAQLIMSTRGLLKKRLWKQSRQHVALNFKGPLQQEPTVMGFDITAQSLWLPVIVLLRGGWGLWGEVGGGRGWQGVLCCLKSAANADVLWPHLSLHYTSRPFAAAGQNWPPFGSPSRGGLLWERFYFATARKACVYKGPTLNLWKKNLIKQE